MAKISLSDEIVRYQCPGCGREHAIPTDRFAGREPKWHFNRSLDRPTLTPSIKCEGGGPKRCHHFVRNGMIEFCSDSQHELAGTTVPMFDVE